MAKNITIAKLDMDTQSLIDSMQKTAKQIENLRDQQEKLAKKGKEGTEQFQANEAALKSLTVAQRAQTAALSAQTTEDGKLVSVKKAVKEAINEVNNSENDYMANNQKLLALKKQLNSNDNDYEKRLAAINGKLQENNNWLEENGSAHAKLVTTMNDYKQQVADSFNEINIFNGGLSGLISRAQEAGGVGPLVKGAFEGMSTGIMGMTKSALAFMATPLGAALTVITALLSPIIDYLTNTEEGIDAVTTVTRPLQSVFQALSGVFQQIGKFLFEAFTNPKKSMEDLYDFVKQNLINRFTAFGTILEGIMDLDFKKISNGVLQAATGVEDVIGKTQKAAKATGQFFDEAIKRGQQIDALQKQLDKSQAGYTSKMGELSTQLDAQKDIAADTNLTFAERETAALKAIEIAKEQNKLALDRMDTEIRLNKLKLKENGLTSAEKQELAEMQTARNEAAARYKSAEQGLQDSLDTIRQETADKEIKRTQKLLDDALDKQKQMLKLYEAENNAKVKSLQQSVDFENERAKQELAIIKRELELKKISWLEYSIAIKEIENARLQNLASINIEHGKAILDLELAKGKSLLIAGEELNKGLIEQENDRLEKEKQLKLNQLALEKGISEQKINMSEEEAKKAGTAAITFYNEKSKIDQEYAAKKQANDDALKKQDAAETARKDQEGADKAALDFELNNSEYEQGLLLEDKRHDQEVAKYAQWKTDKLISEQEETDYIKALDEETAKNKQKLALQNAQTQLGSMQNVANALGEAFGQSKELAIAQATMSAGQAILSIWSGTITGNPLVDTVLKGVLTASTAIKTAKQIKEIQSAKKPKSPKFEQGGLMAVGGNRHSAGGTLFTGSDGTHFEAEHGELIGVMNRNAARHFMAFNNAFPAGGASAPNYFAGGGIVSREIAQQTLNTDELAMKIAQANSMLPQPIVAVQDIITQGNDYVRVRDTANF
jgi:hypothetical protein